MLKQSTCFAFFDKFLYFLLKFFQIRAIETSANLAFKTLPGVSSIKAFIVQSFL